MHEAARFRDHAFVNAIGSDQGFRRLPEILASTDLATDRYAMLGDPAASVSARVRLGRGVTVNHGVSGGGSRIGAR